MLFFLGILLVAVVSILVFVTISKNFQKSLETNNTTVFPIAMDDTRTFGSKGLRHESRRVSEDRSISLVAPSPIPAPEALPSFDQLLLQGSETLERVFSSQGERPQKESSVPMFQNAVSDEEVFNRLWPEDYRQGLFIVVDVMKKDGFVAQDIVVTFHKNQDIYDFLELMLRYAKVKGWIDEERYQSFHGGLINILPETVEQEAQAYRQTGMRHNSLPGNQRLLLSGTSKDIVDTIIDGLGYVFFLAKPAEGAWITGGDCYKDDAPFYPVPGFNSLNFCCNCGLKCAKVCVFVPDCGPHSVACDIPLGCLNLNCKAWPNAIWDPTTGICGCG